MRKTETIIEEIRGLVKSPGYVYVLCIIVSGDFNFAIEKLHEIDHKSRLNTKETAFLFGFIIQGAIDFTMPAPQDFIQMKKRTYELMQELQESFNIPFFNKLSEELKLGAKDKDTRKARQDFFGTGDMFVEPIFYAGTGAYDFQYLEFLERKYKHDSEWLLQAKDFDLKEVPTIVGQIKSMLQRKAERVQLCGLQERVPQILEELKTKYPNEDCEKHLAELLPRLEIYQYRELFLDAIDEDSENDTDEEFSEKGWQSFYQGLMELFTIRKTDFDAAINRDNLERFLDNFSVIPTEGANSRFQVVGDYNLINSHPLISLDSERYFVSIFLLLCEAVYESPYYWMIEDRDYKAQALKNRGTVGEEITYELLSSVFGKDRTYKSLKINAKKGQDTTDIDVLCILGSKALCVQVKSKKLTELSKKGNDKQLKLDFRQAVQDAYRQGLISREKVLQRDAKFIDEAGNEINLSEEIDEVYIMCLTTENYPSLVHQCDALLRAYPKTSECLQTMSAQTRCRKAR